MIRRADFKALILAHRGYHREVPENTIVAFEAAANLGVDGFETDVRSVKDGTLVLFHDRHDPDGRLLRDITREELSEAAGYSVPTLAEALEGFGEFSWNLELKESGVAERTVRTVESLNLESRVLISSYRHDILAFVAARSRIPIGLLFTNRLHKMEKAVFAVWEPFERVRTLIWHFEQVDEELVHTCRKEGYRTFVFRLKTPEDHREMIDLGVDALITDHPEQFYE